MAMWPEFWRNLQRSVGVYEARLVVAPTAVAKALPKSADATTARMTSDSMAALAAKVMLDPRASKILKSLAASELALRDASRQATDEAERTAAQVLRSKRYAGLTRTLAAWVMARSPKGRGRTNL